MNNEMGSAGECCDNCFYAVALDNNSPLEKRRRFCRRYPPTPFLIQGPPPIAGSPPVSVTMCAYPPVERGWLCGEYLALNSRIEKPMQ